MKKILLISTGGTIASKQVDGKLEPQINSAELLSFVPELSSMCQIKTFEAFNRDSTNMTYADWFALSQIIKREYENFDGFVITHGTDTMAYCSSALSYFVQNSSKPIAITGSQKSIYLRDTDARSNLISAFAYVTSKYASGVKLVFDGNVILGTRAKKTHTKSFNAFSSIDYPIVAKIFDGRVINFIKEDIVGKPIFADGYNDSVAVIKLIPGISSDILVNLKGKVKAVIIESFGVGGIPQYENDNFENALKIVKGSGTEVIITTQVSFEGSDVGVYKVGDICEKLGLIEAKDMTLEAIVGKCVWALHKAPRDFATTFLRPIGADILY